MSNPPMTTAVSDRSRERAYPVRPVEDDNDQRFPAGLTCDVIKVVRAHGYPELTGLDMVELQFALFVFCNRHDAFARLQRDHLDLRKHCTQLKELNGTGACVIKELALENRALRDRAVIGRAISPLGAAPSRRMITSLRPSRLNHLVKSLDRFAAYRSTTP